MTNKTAIEYIDTITKCIDQGQTELAKDTLAILRKYLSDSSHGELVYIETLMILLEDAQYHIGKSNITVSNRIHEAQEELQERCSHTSDYRLLKQECSICHKTIVKHDDDIIPAF